MSEVNELEDKNKEFIFTSFDNICSKQTEWINYIKKTLEYMDYTDIDIPNSAITANNKLIELANIFKDANLSIYVDKNNPRKYSFVGESLIEDLLERLNDATSKLSNLSHEVTNYSDARVTSMKLINEEKGLKKFFKNITEFFKISKPFELSISNEEKDKINSLINDYQKSNEDIWNYKIDDRITCAISNAITRNDGDKKHRYSKEDASKVMCVSVIPILDKLGLKNKVSEIYEELGKIYAKDKTLRDVIDKEKFKKILMDKNNIYTESEIVDNEMKRQEENTEINKDNNLVK